MEKTLDQFDGKYSVTDTGIVYSLKGRKKILRGKIHNSGYREVLINHKGIRKYLLVHRLVAEVFIPNSENKRTVNHKDFNKLNCHVANLEWMTDSENVKYSRDNGKMSNYKLTKHDADEIRFSYKTKKTSYGKLSVEYKVSRSCIQLIIENKRWK